MHASELDRDLAEEGFRPPGLLGHPGDEFDRRVGVTDGVMGELDFVTLAEDEVGEVSVVAVGAQDAQEGLFDPGVHHVGDDGHTVDS